MLAKKIEEALNEQITKEAYASNYYLSMASWCETQGYRGSAAFLFEQSAEETEHMLKLLHYVNEAGGHARVAALREPPHNYKSLSQIFEFALEHEMGVTQSINKLVELTFGAKDYASFNFLQWYVAEQHEEEKLFRSILDLLKITSSDSRGLFFIDAEINKLREQSGESSAK